MLTPEYLDHIADDLLELYGKLEESIARDVARRLVKTGVTTATAKWQAELLQEAGLLYDDVITEVARYADVSEKRVRTLFEDAGVRSVDDELERYEAAGINAPPLRMSPASLQILDAGIRKTNGELKNLTMTTAVTTQMEYINAATLAEMQVESGAFSYQAAIRNAVRSASASGVFVSYPSGHRDRLDVAVRRAVMTGINQTAGQISIQYAEDNGCDLMELTAHGGARPSHVIWQGKVVSRSGRPGYLTLSDIGYGTGAGFMGWNCRHSWYPYFEGISEPAYSQETLEKLNAKEVKYEGKEHTQYEASQIQRGMERGIRATKRELAGLDEAIRNTDDASLKNGLRTDFNEASVKLKSQEARLRDFAKQTKRPLETDRVQVQGFGRSTAQKAVWANRKSSIFKDTNIAPLPITSGSVDAIKPFKCSLLSEALQKKLADEHKKLLISISSKPLGTEASATYDLNLVKLSHTIGADAEARVKIPKASVPYIGAHTHPTGGTFTHTDLWNFAMSENMEMLTAVGNNGAVYAVEKTEKFSSKAFSQYYEKMDLKHPDYLASVEKYEEYIQDFLKGIDEYGIRYYTTGTQKDGGFFEGASG